LTFPLLSDKLSKPSWVKISQIRTISVERIGKRMGSVDSDDLAQIVDGLLELMA
jgi:mRNA interferase MazF